MNKLQRVKSVLTKIGNTVFRKTKEYSHKATEISCAVGGVCMISLGIAMIFVPAGVIVGGVSLLFMGWRMSDE